MIGDPLYISEIDYLRAKKILKNLFLREYKIILIGGGSGTKKSEFAYALQKQLFNKKKSSFIISLDDYYNTHITIRSINRKKLGIDSAGLSEINWEHLYFIYENFQNKKEIYFKRTHRFLDTIENNAIESKDIDYLIFEGLYTNYLRKFYNNNYSIYLEGTPKQTLKFRQLRGKENENDEFRKKIVQREFNVVSQLKKYADKIIQFED